MPAHALLLGMNRRSMFSYNYQETPIRVSYQEGSEIVHSKRDLAVSSNLFSLLHHVIMWHHFIFALLYIPACDATFNAIAGGVLPSFLQPIATHGHFPSCFYGRRSCSKDLSSCVQLVHAYCRVGAGLVLTPALKPYAVTAHGGGASSLIFSLLTYAYCLHYIGVWSYINGRLKVHNHYEPDAL